MKRTYIIPTFRWFLIITALVIIVAVVFVNRPLQAEKTKLPRVWAAASVDKPEEALESAFLIAREAANNELRSKGVTNFEIWQTADELIVGLHFQEDAELPSDYLVMVLRDNAGQPWNTTDISLTHISPRMPTQVWVSLGFDEGVITSRNENSVIEIGFETDGRFVFAPSGYQLTEEELEEAGSLTPLYELAPIYLSNRPVSNRSN